MTSTLVTGALLITMTSFADSPQSNAHPLSAEVQMAIAKDLESSVTETGKQIEVEPDVVEHYSRRGDAYFFQGKFAKAVADYEKMVELNPKLETSHWRRGIAYFYADDFKKAAHQFEIYHSFDNVDRENGIWRFLSQTKAYGIEKAREGLLQYEKDDREPFPSVYKLFAGDITPEEILKSIESAEIDDDAREVRLFYAHLYIGLNHYVTKNKKAAKLHLEKAVGNTWAPKASFGPRYMWHVGRVHYELLLDEKTE